MPDVTPSCPLCGATATRPFERTRTASYFRCQVCLLTFMDPAQRPDPAAERARYDEHRNDPSDAGYRAFLAHLADPVMQRIGAGARGLDYGSGPGPTLSLMLREGGFDVELYDPFYAPDERVLDRAYDFVVCSETAEHFHEPSAEFERLHGLLRPGGLLGVMTELLEDDARFATWRYARDPTHVCFYRLETLQWIGERWAWRMERAGRNVVLYTRP